MHMHTLLYANATVTSGARKVHTLWLGWAGLLGYTLWDGDWELGIRSCELGLCIFDRQDGVG